MPIRKKQTLRDKLEDHFEDLLAQTDDLRQQVVERAPGVRDQLIAALPDKERLVDLRDDLFEKLPDGVQEKLPERAKPKRKRLRKVAVVGVVAGAGAAVFAIVKRRAEAPPAYTPPPPYTPPPAPRATSTPPPSATEPAPQTPATPPDPAAGDPFAAEPRMN